MGAVGVIVAVVLALAVLLLALPIGVAFRIEGIQAFQGHLSIRWMFGLMRFKLRIPGVLQSPQETTAAPNTANARGSARRRRGRSSVLALLRQAAFRQRVYRLVGDLASAAHLRQLHLRLRLGLGDPADTGRLWAVLGPLNAVAQKQRHADVQIEPDYLEPVFEFQARGRLLLIPLQFLILAIGFALSPVSIRAWRTLKGDRA